MRTLLAGGITAKDLTGIGNFKKMWYNRGHGRVAELVDALDSKLNTLDFRISYK